MIAEKPVNPANTKMAAPFVPGPKRDGSLRFFVDYQKLNSVKIQDSYPLPRIDECMDRLREATVFSSPASSPGYWQIKID